METESNIVYQRGAFYAYRIKEWIEIRKNSFTHATLIGVAKDEIQAKRFIDRAILHPEMF